MYIFAKIKIHNTTASKIDKWSRKSTYGSTSAAQILHLSTLSSFIYQQEHTQRGAGRQHVATIAGDKCHFDICYIRLHAGATYCIIAVASTPPPTAKNVPHHHGFYRMSFRNRGNYVNLHI
jgi:hypothetical protein